MGGVCPPPPQATEGDPGIKAGRLLGSEESQLCLASSLWQLPMGQNESAWMWGTSPTPSDDLPGPRCSGSGSPSPARRA